MTSLMDVPLTPTKIKLFFFFPETEQQQWRPHSKQQEEEHELPRQDVGRDQELVVAVRTIGPAATDGPTLELPQHDVLEQRRRPQRIRQLSDDELWM